MQTIQATIDSISDDAKIIPGHDPLSNKQELVIYLKMLQYSIKFVKQNLEQGITLEELLKIELPIHLKSWETGSIKGDRWLTFIYDKHLTG